MARLAVWLIICSLFDASLQFYPNTLPGIIDSTTSTHQNITNWAIHVVATNVIQENKTAYPAGPDTLSTDSFREALAQLLAASAQPDLSYDEQTSPEAHFDAEEFSDSSRRIAKLRRQTISAIKTFRMKTARNFAGRAIHTLQDFYSHSNWIELGNNVIHPGLDFRDYTGITSDKVARPDQTTCNDCNGTPAEPCRGNIAKEIINQHLLTSGYNWLFDTPYKPTGKCGHGGLYDTTRHLSPTGGINKDTADKTLSPHHYLHYSAGKLAFHATVNFLESIRDAVVDPQSSFRDRAFSEFLGLALGGSTTLCFIVDTTGSMSAEIGAVRQITINITERASVQERPSDYLLSPFNDKTSDYIGYGPVFKTTNASAMIEALRDLRADGGGDGPELAFHGILEAVENVRVGSTCYFFTDASAKDVDLYPVVSSLIIEKKVKLIAMLTGNAATTRTSKRSVSRHKRRSTYSYYDSLTQISGGLIVGIDDRRVISQATEIVKLSVRVAQVTVAYVKNPVDSVTFPSDISLREILLQLSDTSGSLLGVNITSQNGTQYTSYSTLVSLNTLLVYNLSRLDAGNWTVSVSTSVPGSSFDVRVTAVSKISFTFEFGEPKTGSHPGYEPVSGSPLADTLYYVIVRVFGARDSTTGLPLGLLQNVTHVLLISDLNNDEMKLDASELTPLTQYAAQTKLPMSGFRVGWEGVDQSGNRVRRVDEKVMAAVNVKVEIRVQGNGSFDVFAGTSLTVTVNITNVGNTSTWHVRVQDTSAFYNGSSEIRIANLPTRSSRTLSLNFYVPSDAAPGNISTAVVTVGGSAVTDVENRAVFYIYVKPTVIDDTAPNCTVEHVFNPCENISVSQCRIYNWIAEFIAVDTGSGIQAVTSRSSSPSSSSSLKVSDFSAGMTSPINGSYTASCCHSNVSIVVADTEGNVGQCVVVVTLATTTAATTTTSTTTATQDPCELTWIQRPNTNVLGGTVNSASTLEECKAACASNASCTGVDWNPTASAGQACWLSGPCSGRRRDGIVPSITHYDIVRPDRSICPGPCDPRWRTTLDTRVLNGANISAQSEEACKAACVRNTSCTGVDWNPTASAGKRCWLSGPWSANPQSAPGITRFDLYRNQSCPEVCEPRWITTVNTRVLGGTVISASSLEECKAACESNASCTGVDWNPTASAGQACWLSGPCSGHRIVGLAPGFTRYGIVRDCDATVVESRCPVIPDSWIAYANTHVYSGIADSASDFDSCQETCVRDSSCTRVDWSPGASAGQLCWIHGPRSRSQPRRPLPGVSHYELKRLSVSHWVIYADSYAQQGVATDAVDLSGCQDSCVYNGSCARMDWYPGDFVGRRCWIHGPWSSSQSRQPLVGVLQYELHRGSDGFCGCSPTWESQGDVHVRGGVSSSATTVGDCRTHCAHDAGCTAVDWNGAASTGQQCWLHGSWSRGPPVYRPGVQHHVITRTCSCSVSWTTSLDTSVDGGVSTGSATVAECFNDCYCNTSCTAVDWYQADSVERRCWLHGSWSSDTWNANSGVQHFIIDRPACDPQCSCKRTTTWHKYSDMHVWRGRLGFASTLSSCQAACVADHHCTGIDYIRTWSSYQCWLHGPWSAGNTLNSFTGADHYDLTRNTVCNG